MISIRLKKHLSKQNPTYSIIVVSSTEAATSGRFIEKIGFYKPSVDLWSNKYLFINSCKLLYWLKRGAKLNNSVFILIRPLIFTLLQEK